MAHRISERTTRIRISRLTKASMYAEGIAPDALSLSLLLLLRRRLRRVRVPIRSRNRTAELSDQFLRRLSVWSIGLQVKILLQGLDRARRSRDLARSIRRRFACQSDAVLILRIRVVGVRRNRLLELLNGLVVLACIYQQRAHVVVILAGARWIELGRFLQIRPRIIQLLVFG